LSSHIQRTTNEITNTTVQFNKRRRRRRQMATHTKRVYETENNTTISYTWFYSFTSFAFIYEYPPLPLHTSLYHQNNTAHKLMKLKNPRGVKQ
jgi:hypothetical protein